MLNWNSIDTVLLDMDGTLLDLHFDTYFWLTHLPKRYAQEHKVSESEALALITENVEKHRGTLNWYCLDHWSELVNLDIPALKREVVHKIKIRPHAEAFLNFLRAQNKRLVLITNAHPKGLALKLEVTEIDRLLDIVISSHEFSAPKEDQAFWNALAKHEPFELERTLFIDDTPSVLKSAQTFGIKYLLQITHPDSQKPVQRFSEFLSVQHFDELMEPKYTTINEPY